MVLPSGQTSDYMSTQVLLLSLPTAKSLLAGHSHDAN